MIALLCITDVQMRRSDTIAFKKGQVYEWHLLADGSIQRYSSEGGYHSFRSDTWGSFFKFDMEKEHEQLV